MKKKNELNPLQQIGREVSSPKTLAKIFFAINFLQDFKMLIKGMLTKDRIPTEILFYRLNALIHI